jgi:hypothetical protein
MATTSNGRKAPVFPSAVKKTAGAKDPESLFGDLPRSRTAKVGALWSHQADQLRIYSEQHQKSADVALELPTGSGKTVVGLLAAEWRRQELGHRVVYACPTVQLARQVVAVGNEQGFSVRDLTGRSADWDRRAVSDYTRGAAMAVTTYSAIFNSNSRFGDSKTLIFDDAHAAEGYVAEAWALRVPQSSNTYAHLFDAFEGAIDPLFVSRMSTRGADISNSNSQEVRMIPLAAVESQISEIDSVLDSELSGDSSYRFAMIRANLVSCLFYVSNGAWYIRPMIPPTFEHAPFVDPEQRIYLSATLGDAGELERAFGRTPIARVPVPPAWERTGSGRRFFVFPDIADSTDEDYADTNESESNGCADETETSSLLRQLSALSAKRLILTPDGITAKAIADELLVPEQDRFLAEAKSGVEDFRSAATGTLLAPSRYDGMDLADATCRFLIMDGLPGASHLQDRFLESKLRAGDVLAERIRTRVIQGAGRCTRGPQDWAVIVVRGEQLLRYFSNRDNTGPMPVELQAEIDFGLLASRSSPDNIVALTESALNQDDAWREHGESALADGRQRAVRDRRPMAAELAGSAAREVAAWKSAWLGDWEEAADRAVTVLEGLTGSNSRPYRALWAYLASAWYQRCVRSGDSAAKLRSLDLLKLAHKAAAGSTWLREVAPLPSEFKMVELSDESAVERIIDRLNNGALVSSARFSERAHAMEIALARTEAVPYELALVELGHLLGAESFKPSGDGQTDAAWLWSDLWLSLEAKSEQTTEMLSMDYVRKANTQLDSLASMQSVDSAPQGSVSVIVAPSRLVNPGAVSIANTNLYLVPVELVLTIAHETHRAWTKLRSSLSGLDAVTARETATKILWEQRILPTQIKDRLTHEPIRG